MKDEAIATAGPLPPGGAGKRICLPFWHDPDLSLLLDPFRYYPIEVARMVNPELEAYPAFGALGRLKQTMSLDDIIIETLSVETEPLAIDLIQRNLQGYAEAGSVLAATFRRISNLMAVYHQPGARFFVLRDAQSGGSCIGAAGLGSLHGLPPSEGAGELRDLVLEKDFRGKGLGSRLIKRCIEEARALGYRRLYLETTPQMEMAQKLFMRFGFRPVTQAGLESTPHGEAPLPCYFILDDLRGHTS